jgi:hypothetical protein
MAEIILVAVLALVVVSGVVLWHSLAKGNARVIGAPPGGEPGELFRGGMMGRHLLTSGTMVRLEFFDWGVRLAGNMFFRWLIPTWEARYDQLAIAELAALPASRIIVWLRLRGEPGAIGFLSHDSREILTLLKDRGVPVNRSITQVRNVAELYQ